MRRILGILISFVGIMLFIKPAFDLFETFETFAYLIDTYWPLLLICFGFFLQNSTSTKKRR